MAEKWTDDELAASVEAYVAMQEEGRAGRHLNKREVYRSLAARFPRTEKSFELHMQNISHVLAQNGCDWLEGLAPATNVGTDVARKIVRHLNRVRFERAASEGSPRPGRLFGWDKDGAVLWPFEQGLNPEDIGWTLEDGDAFLRLTQTVGEDIQTTREVPNGVAVPPASNVTVRSYARDSAVIDWVLRESKGACECCLLPAPFLAKDGKPFLEVHHVRQLAEGGSDTVSNTVAVCPNCHRRLHYGNGADGLRAGLIATVPRLRDELDINENDLPA